MYALCTIHTILYKTLGSSFAVGLSELAFTCLHVNKTASFPEVRKIIRNTECPDFNLQSLFYLILPAAGWRQDWAVGIATSYGLDDQQAGARFLAGAALFS
jgi:uncharacterized membrane protein